MKSITIVVPVYFNEESLQSLCMRLEGVCCDLKLLGVNASVVFVDDGSGDGSWDILKNLKIENINITLIKHTKNYGTVQAIKTGYSHLKTDCYTCIAADLQDPPELILEMVKLWLNTDYKIILCSRRQKSDGFFNDLFSSYYFKLMNIFLGKYPVGGFDIALIDHSLIKYFCQIPKYMYFQPLVIGLGYKYLQLPYTRIPRAHGNSRNNLLKKIRYFSDSVLSLSNYPLRFVTIFSLLIAAISLGYSSYLIVYKIIYGIEIKGFTTLVALISFIGASIISLLGIIGEYVWRIYDSKYGLPCPVVDEIIQLKPND